MKSCTMKQADKELSEIPSLVSELKEGTILAGRFARLDAILSAKPKAREHYAEVVQLYTNLEFLFKDNSVPVSFPGQARRGVLRR